MPLRRGSRGACVLLLLASTAASGEDPVAPVVEFPCSWEAGTRFRLVLEKGRKEFDGDKPTHDGHSTSDIDVEVVRADEEGYLFRWTFTDTRLPEAASRNPLAVRVGRIMQGLVLDLKADEYGSVQALENGAAVRRRLEEVFTAVRASAVAGGADEAAIKALLDPLVKSLLGEEMEHLLIHEARIFSFPSGGSFVPGEERPYEDALPLPFTGEMIPTKAAFLLRGVDGEAGTAELVWRQKLDGEKTKQAIARYLEAVAKKSGLPGAPAEEMERLSFDVEDEATFVYDLATGIPRSVHWSRTTKVASKRRIDWLRFTTSAEREGDR